MHTPFIISITISLLLLTACQQDQSCSISRGSHIQIGNKVNICLKIKAQNTTYVYAFGIVVDRFSALQIGDIGDVLNESGVVTLSLQYHNIVSQQQILLQNDTEGVYRNLVSLILQSTQGALTNIYSEFQDCSSCSAGNQQVCMDGQCFYRGDLSYSNQLMIYVSWIGTDLAGQHFVSHTLRLSKLSRFAQQNVYVPALALAK